MVAGWSLLLFRSEGMAQYLGSTCAPCQQPALASFFRHRVRSRRCQDARGQTAVEHQCFSELEIAQLCFHPYCGTTQSLPDPDTVKQLHELPFRAQRMIRFHTPYEKQN